MTPPALQGVLGFLLLGMALWPKARRRRKRQSNQHSRCRSIRRSAQTTHRLGIAMTQEIGK